MTPSNRPNIMTVYGTRPEAIKVAPVIKALEESEVLDSVTVVTGQHREMLDQVNEIFGVSPSHDLDIFQHGSTLSSIVARVLDRLDPILVAEQPAAVTVQGDTSTSTAAALAAFHRGIPVVHVEAGLRSGNMHSPFPEEANRKITTQIASLHLTPTTRSRNNLISEGVSEDLVYVTGNTVIDALFMALERVVPFTDPRLERLSSKAGQIVLVTTHRRENWGGAMIGVGRALARLARSFPEVDIVLPVHRNPIVREAVIPQLEGLQNVVVTEPLPYGEFTRLLSMASVVVTDSGGVQEEAPSLGKPVLVMRSNTERPAAVDAGTVKLVGTDEDRIVGEVTTLLTDESQYAAMARAINPYGDGRSAGRTVQAIAHYLGLGEEPTEFA